MRRVDLLLVVREEGDSVVRRLDLDQHPGADRE
jgi:hypothetical protein